MKKEGYDLAKKNKSKVKVKGSKPHRRTAHWVRGYWMRRTNKAYRNKPYNRNKARSPEEIKKKGTRKQERKEKRMKQVKNQTKGRSGKQKTKLTVQTTFGTPRGPAKVK